MMWRLIGSILLMVGTCLGAGILALPVATAASGFYATCFLLFICWFVSTAAAFYLLEANLHLPLNSNIISMAKHTLGLPGRMLAWVMYLLLLYSLLAAYMSGGSDVVKNLLGFLHIHLPSALNTCIFLIILSYIIFRGIRVVDWTNRGLMITKLVLFFLFCALALHHTTTTNINAPGKLHMIIPAIMVVITAFGFSIIIPTLRVYLKDDVRLLRISIMSSSFIALFCYLLWTFVVQGVVPHHGHGSLTDIANADHVVSNLTQTLSVQINQPIMSSFIEAFTIICIFTSFLGVALSLSDFLADGLQLPKLGKNKALIYIATFLPPLLLTLFSPGLFITALQYAGIFCVILLIIMPTLMAWRLRKSATEHYQVWGGTPLILATLGLSALLLIIGIPGLTLFTLPLL